MKIKKHEFNKLDKQEKEDLIELLKNGTKQTVGKQANKGWIDTPLFLSVEEEKQLKLF